MWRRWFSTIRVCFVLACCLQVFLLRSSAELEGAASPLRRSTPLDLADIEEETEEVKGTSTRCDELGRLCDPTASFVESPSVFLVLQQCGLLRVSFLSGLPADADEPRAARGPPA